MSLDASLDLQLVDGTPLVVRRLSPADAPLLTAAMERLSPTSRYRRFMTPLHRLSPAMLRYLTEVDHHHHLAWGARSPGGEGVGVARCIRLTDEPTIAEAAVTVADDWQSRGVGTLLLDVRGGSDDTEVACRGCRGQGATTKAYQRYVEAEQRRHRRHRPTHPCWHFRRGHLGVLTRDAVAQGITGFRGYVLPANGPMRGLINELGGRLTPSSTGLLQVDAALPPDPTRLPDTATARLFRAAAEGRLPLRNPFISPANRAESDPTAEYIAPDRSEGD